MMSPSEAGPAACRHSAIDQTGRIEMLAASMKEVPAGLPLPVLGSRVRIWKQDPSVSGLAIREAYIHTRIEAGPCDSQITIAGLPRVHPDVNGDFLFDSRSALAFDAVHAYAVVRQVLTLYQRLLDQRLGWQWNRGRNREPISVFPRAGEGLNAYYSRGERALKFLFGRRPGDTLPVYTCQSLDVVAHEAGHAVLDALQPQWIYASAPPQTGALHEAFGDLTAIFLILSHLDQVEYIIAETKADLHRKNVLAELAEQFGSALGRPTGLRNADNDLRLSEVSHEVHDLSRVFTGAVYDILADAFTASRNPRLVDDARTLYEAGQRVAELTVRAIRQAPGRDATFADVARAMIAIAMREPGRFPDYAALIEKQFDRREVFTTGFSAAAPAIPGLAPSRTCCCGTMRLAEYEEAPSGRGRRATPAGPRPRALTTHPAAPE